MGDESQRIGLLEISLFLGVFLEHEILYLYLTSKSKLRVSLHIWQGVIVIAASPCFLQGGFTILQVM